MKAFQPGAPVRVRDDWPERSGPVHLRTPHYLRGRSGRVVRGRGACRNPEDLAVGRPAQVVPLYHVAFAAPGIWPGSTAADVLVEIFEHWLEPAP